MNRKGFLKSLGTMVLGAIVAKPIIDNLPTRKWWYITSKPDFLSNATVIKDIEGKFIGVYWDQSSPGEIFKSWEEFKKDPIWIDDTDEKLGHFVKINKDQPPNLPNEKQGIISRS